MSPAVSDDVEDETRVNLAHQHPQETEDILAVPRIWTKRAYQLLVEHDAVPRPWHLEGRWGSRTHRVDDQRMGFPIISKIYLEEKAEEHPAIRELLDVQGVAILVDQPFVASHRARDPVFYDASIHPERQRPTGNQWDEASLENQPSKVPLFTYAELFAGVGTIS